MRKFRVVLILALMILFTGCISLSHDITQNFKDDGSSDITINYSLELDNSLYNENNMSISLLNRIVGRVVYDYISMGKHIKNICNAVEKNKIL